MIKSPGNAIRAGYFEKSHDIVRTVSNALLYSFIDPFKFLTLPLVVYTILNFSRIRELIPESIQKYKKELILVMLGLFFISFAPSLWGMGRRPNPRTMNIIFQNYLILFFPVLLLFLKNLNVKRWMSYSVVGLLFCMPVTRLVSDYFSGRISAYNKMWEINLSTRGKISPEKSEVPLSIHFSFVEIPAEHFEKFLKARPEFYE